MLKKEIEKILERFGDEMSFLIEDFNNCDIKLTSPTTYKETLIDNFKQSLQQIADLKDKQFEKDLDDIHKMHQHRIEEAISACVPEEARYADIYKYHEGYNKCIQDMRKNRDNYLKE